MSVARKEFPFGACEQKQVVDVLVQRFDPVVAIYLFGSRARQNASPLSDVDLLVILDDPEISKNRFQIINEMYEALVHTFVPVEILVYSQQEVEDRRQSPFDIVTTSISDGKLLYARSS